MTSTRNPSANLAATAWQLITAGVNNPQSDAHWPMLATTDSRESTVLPSPNVRTVVLRAASETQRWIQAYSDNNGPLVADLRANPTAMMAFYDRTTRSQIRAKGEVSIYNQSDLSDKCWALLSPSQRTDYTGRESFAVLRLAVATIDYLCLMGPGQRSARLDYRARPMTTTSPKP